MTRLQEIQNRDVVSEVPYLTCSLRLDMYGMLHLSTGRLYVLVNSECLTTKRDYRHLPVISRDV